MRGSLLVGNQCLNLGLGDEGAQASHLPGLKGFNKSLSHGISNIPFKAKSDPQRVSVEALQVFRLPLQQHIVEDR